MIKKNQEKEANPKKVKEVEKLAEKIKGSRSVLVVGTKGLPSKQFQDIRKKIRKNAEIFIARTNIINRGIDKASVGAKKLEPYIKENTAIVFSQLDPFELSAILSENKTSAAAKVGDVVNEDINIEPGPTDLVPGPVISELGALGLKIAVEDGKISIKQAKVIVKAGEAVNPEAASLMQKLDIKPMSIGLIPIVAYDNETKEIYTEIKIDKEGTLSELKIGLNKALGLAIKLGYICKDTLSYILSKANAEYNKLSSLIKDTKETTEEKTSEEKTEEEKENTQENKSEEEK